MNNSVLFAAAAVASGVAIALFSRVATKFYVNRLDTPTVAELPLMTCPITLAPLIDPVVASDGHTYERCAIEAWFRAGHKISPVTGEELPNTNLITNWMIRQCHVKSLSLSS